MVGILPISWLAWWDRRIGNWRKKAQQVLLLRENRERLFCGEGCAIAPDTLWRLSDGCQVFLGDHVTIRPGTEIKSEGKLSIGRNTLVGNWCVISALEDIAIGEDCLIGERVSIRDHDHYYRETDLPIRDQGYLTEGVRIEDDVWIGAGVVICKGVTLGRHCVVGANAVVTRSFPSGSVIAGVPARLIRKVEPAVGSNESP